MSRSQLTTTLLALVLLFAACNSSRKASDRRCAKAERHRAKAIWLCPAMLTLDSATVTFTLPADSVERTLAYSDPEVDSMLKACEQFAAAVALQRDSLMRLAHVAMAQPRPLLTDQVRQVERTGVQHAVSAAVQRIQRNACDFETTTTTVGLCSCTVRPGPNGPLITVEQASYAHTETAPCPPAVGAAPCPAPGVANWYRSAFWGHIALDLICLIILGLFLARSFSKWPAGYN